MSNGDLFGISFRNLLKRKMRTFLTILGVSIGSASIVLMLSLGVGVNRNFEAQKEQMGDLTLIEVYNWENSSSSDKNALAINDDMIKRVEAIKGVAVASPVMDSYLYFVAGRYSMQTSVLGVRPEVMEALGIQVAEGRYPASDAHDIEVFFSPNAKTQFMTDSQRNSPNTWRRGGMISVGGMGVISIEGGSGGGTGSSRIKTVDVLNERITLYYLYNGANFVPDSSFVNYRPPDQYRVKGVGIMAQNANSRYSYYTVMNIKDVAAIRADNDKYNKAVYGGTTPKRNGYDQMIVKCDSMDNVKHVTEELKALGFNNYYTPMTQIDAMKETTGSLQNLLTGIGAVALFVAAIGIANTMYMSIYERTKEIGIMKVIGARLNDIRKLFLTEAAFIGFLGGGVGVVLSYVVSYVLNTVGVSFLSSMNEQYYYYGSNGEKSAVSIIPIELVAAALLFSIVIGLISGFLPARRAMRLSALSAIRVE